MKINFTAGNTKPGGSMTEDWAAVSEPEPLRKISKHRHNGLVENSIYNTRWYGYPGRKTFLFSPTTSSQHRWLSIFLSVWNILYGFFYLKWSWIARITEDLLNKNINNITWYILHFDKNEKGKTYREKCVYLLYPRILKMNLIKYTIQKHDVFEDGWITVREQKERKISEKIK